jgi:hypothetical protein
VPAHGECTSTFAQGWEHLDSDNQQRVNLVVLAILDKPDLREPWRQEWHPGDPNSWIADVSLGDLGIVYRSLEKAKRVRLMCLAVTGDEPQEPRTHGPVHPGRVARLVRVFKAAARSGTSAEASA